MRLADLYYRDMIELWIDCVLQGELLMTTEPVDLFYSYAHEDEALRNKINVHLASLRRQGSICEWHDREILAGSPWAQEIDSHLQTARIILLLVSPDFMASDYCYGVEVREAMRRHAAGDAIVIPIILRPCDWEQAPFGQLQALPKDAKPVTLWANRDAAFLDIAKGIGKTIAKLHGSTTPRVAQATTTRQKGGKAGEGIGERTMQQEIPTTPVPATRSATLSAPVLKKALTHYYKELDGYKGKADYELAVRSAFQNLLADTARHVSWTLIPEQTLANGARPDGTLRDDYFARGYWEAKGPDKDLEKEIAEKIKKGYPLTNIIFENTRQAILYQNKKRVMTVKDMSKANEREVEDLIRQFLTHTEPDIENFGTAVQEFKERIPELARAVLLIIEQEHKVNNKFKAAFESFAQLCRSSLDPNISKDTLNEMLIQHLLTERLFRTVFENSDFVSRNVIAAEIEKVIQALTSRSFNRREFLKSLDRFYIAIESAAKSIDTWSERQSFLNTVYERFFQGFAVKRADTLGIVYTPQEIVDFMCASVEEVLQREFGTSIAEPGVQILDPATGTGNFIVNLMRRIPRPRLKHKYMHDLFCNEITLLPYYIASLNIEHEYYERMKEYESFEGICFADTLELAEGQQLSLFVEENTERVQREKDAQIMVVIGNPPYNVGQKNENDNNKNRRYPKIDDRIKETYVKDSKATLKTQLYDAYVKFFRWATDRLQGRDGVVCLVTNNSFVDQFAFDGMRRHLLKDFNHIYHLDLHGNVRKNSKLSGTTHNVFGIQVGVGITIAIRNSQDPTSKLLYYHVPEDWKKTEKLAFLAKQGSCININWQNLEPDERYTWITENLHSEFTKFVPLGIKRSVLPAGMDVPAFFKIYSSGVKTNRDAWVYDFNRISLREKMQIFIEAYNSDVDHWLRSGNSDITVGDFVTYDDRQIKWSGDLKIRLEKGRHATYSERNIRHSLYRPFVRRYLYFDDFLNNSIYLQRLFFPTLSSESENTVICLTDLASEKPFMTLVANIIPDLHLVGAGCGTQCFPYYVYSEGGTNRRENITDWALKQFQAKYGEQVSKWDIFHYVYGLLHHPQYRERYVENLKRDLPHIPLLARPDAFWDCVRIGEQLMDLHLNYEQAKEYPLTWLENEDVPFSWRVEKMRLSTDRRVVVVNESLRLGPLPAECFEYRLGNRSALEWVIDQYQVSKDARSGIESDPNRSDDEEYIVHLVGRVVTVSVETVKLANELAQAVTVEDWLGEAVGLDAE